MTDVIFSSRIWSKKENFMERRNINFDLSNINIRDWHEEGHFVSQFHNALSILFPDGERFFIKAVRDHQKDIEKMIEKENNIEQKNKLKDLLKDTKIFIGQEAMHGREHEEYNNLLDKNGYPSEKITKFLNKLLNFSKKKYSRKTQLEMTIALEHYTAILAFELLERFEKAKKEGKTFSSIEKLWMWHALEEHEHKHVAYDTYYAIYPKNIKNHISRSSTMIWLSAIFFAHTTYNFLALLEKDKSLLDKKEWQHFINYTVGKNGFFRNITDNFLCYFKYDFHPLRLVQSKEHAINMKENLEIVKT